MKPALVLAVAAGDARGKVRNHDRTCRCEFPPAGAADPPNIVGLMTPSVIVIGGGFSRPMKSRRSSLDCPGSLPM